MNLGVVHLMAILVVRHVSVHIRMIVAVMTRSAVVVIRREMRIVIRRRPAGVVIIITTIAVEQRRTANEYRLNDVVVAVDIRVADHLYIRVSVHAVHAFHNEGCHVLIDVLCQHSLNHVQVVVAVAGFHHAEVIHIAVTIQVEVRNHVLIRVQDCLEFLYRVALCISSCNSLKVQIQADIGSNGAHLYGCRRAHATCGNAHGRSGIRRYVNRRCLRIANRSSRVGYCYDTGEAARAAYRSCKERKKLKSLHIRVF